MVYGDFGGTVIGVPISISRLTNRLLRVWREEEFHASKNMGNCRRIDPMLYRHNRLRDDEGPDVGDIAQ